MVSWFNNRHLSAGLVALWLTSTCLAAQVPKLGGSTYLSTRWTTLTCRAKGRFQDKEYCSSREVDRILADGKSAIPNLIAQISDARRMQETVFDFWPPVRVGELAYFILGDLFLDDTWQKITMPPLLPIENCDDPGWVCWDRFRQKYSLKQLQSRWMKFWTANQENIYWDSKARCFRLKNIQAVPLKR